MNLLWYTVKSVPVLSVVLAPATVVKEVRRLGGLEPVTTTSVLPIMEENTRTVVCVEDEPEMIDLYRLILNRRGYEVIGADGGREGLAFVREHQPDLVLLDLMMPDMDGWEVYKQLKADAGTAAIPVIVVTAKAQSIDKVLGLHIAQVDDYISKPFSPQELLDSVEKVLLRRHQLAK